MKTGKREKGGNPQKREEKKGRKKDEENLEKQ
jgi:hypothetical protein